MSLSGQGRVLRFALVTVAALSSTAASGVRAAEPPAASSETIDALSVKEAFDAAKDLDTIDGWNAFLARHPSGFLSDIARAYVQKLGAPGQQPAADTASPAEPGTGTQAPPAAADAQNATTELSATTPSPVITRGGTFMGFPEKFNRYYTDPAWLPVKLVYVSPTGGGDGSTREGPMKAADAIAAARPGTQITFTRGKYQGCFEFTKENSGTYDDPVVLYAERGGGTQSGVELTCCSSGRETCFNLEDANHVALDGFELVGGKYGVRTIGNGFAASQHASGIAVLSCKGHDQKKDPFFSGAVDWAVWQGNVAYGAKEEDGHGFYLSNGGDWNIVRSNETYSNARSDFQINPDPASTCTEPGIPVTDPRCDAYAGEGEGGQGASDYFLVESNYFHHNLGNGPNFTSTRRSIIRNNIFGAPLRHNVSFWQETDNPKLGASDNKILHNLFMSTGRHAVQFSVNSTRNEFVNNLLLGVTIDGGTATGNASALLMEVDGTVGENVYRGNVYVAGKLEGRDPGAGETVLPAFQAGWFAKFPTALNHDPADFKPAPQAPFLAKGELSTSAPTDREGNARSNPTDPGPFEVP